jgi:hypothetical protein
MRAPTAASSNVYASVVGQCSTSLGRRHAVIQIGRPRSAIWFGQIVVVGALFAIPLAHILLKDARSTMDGRIATTVRRLVVRALHGRIKKEHRLKSNPP